MTSVTLWSKIEIRKNWTKDCRKKDLYFNLWLNEATGRQKSGKSNPWHRRNTQNCIMSHSRLKRGHLWQLWVLFVMTGGRCHNLRVAAANFCDCNRTFAALDTEAAANFCHCNRTFAALDTEAAANFCHCNRTFAALDTVAAANAYFVAGTLHLQRQFYFCSLKNGIEFRHEKSNFTSRENCLSFLQRPNL